MKVFLSLSLFFSLVSPAVLQTCRKCEHSSSTECTNNLSVRCYFDEYSCQSSVITGNLLRFISRSRYSCGLCRAGNYAFTTGVNGSFNMAVRCCKSDRCNQKPLEIPSEPKEPNGRECTGCYAEDKKECKGVELVRCSGNQTKCMKMKVEVQQGYGFGGMDSHYFSARGCATPDMCEEMNLMYNVRVEGLNVYFTVECSKAL